MDWIGIPPADSCAAIVQAWGWCLSRTGAQREAAVDDRRQAHPCVLRRECSLRPPWGDGVEREEEAPQYYFLAEGSLAGLRLRVTRIGLTQHRKGWCSNLGEEAQAQDDGPDHSINK
jgi:hypothetical protein